MGKFYSGRSIKRIVVAFLTVTFLCLSSAFVGCSALFTGRIWYYPSMEGDYAIVLKYDGNAKKIGIAPIYKDLLVKSIGSHAFKDKKRLTKVVIPNSVIDIGKEAFSGCTALKEIVFPLSVQFIGDKAFEGCTALTNMEIPDSIMSISDSAFLGCVNLKYNVYGNLKYLDNKNNPYVAAISVCDKDLTSYTLHENTKVIANYAFAGCTQLTDIVIPDGITAIGDFAFSKCTALKSISLPESIKKVGRLAFEDCNALETVTLADGLSLDGFENLKNIKKLTCSINALDYNTPDYGIQTLVLTSGMAMEDWFRCSDIITNVILPDSVMKIVDDAFYGCQGLKSIMIPDSVVSIGNKAFDMCDGLSTVYYKGTKEEWRTISVGSDNFYLEKATKYYYSEYEPPLNGAGTAYYDNFWHYDVDGNIVVWEKA